MVVGLFVLNLMVKRRLLCCCQMRNQKWENGTGSLGQAKQVKRLENIFLIMQISQVLNAKSLVAMMSPDHHVKYNN
jgi:hypothetical protein